MSAGMVEVLKSLRARLILPMHYFNPYTLNRFLDRIRNDFPVERARAHHRRVAGDPAGRAQGAGAAGELSVRRPGQAVAPIPSWSWSRRSRSSGSWTAAAASPGVNHARWRRSHSGQISSSSRTSSR